MKVGVNVDNIVKNGEKIAEGAGEAGYQAQKGIGETLGGIQKFLEGVSIFG